MKTRTDRSGTLRGRIARTTAANTAAAAVGLLGCFAGTALTGPQALTESVRAPLHERVDRVQVLMAQHDCWSGAAPAASPEPRHAVVTLPGHRARLVPAAMGYRIWLEGHEGTLHAFCR